MKYDFRRMKLKCRCHGIAASAPGWLGVNSAEEFVREYLRDMHRTICSFESAIPTKVCNTVECPAITGAEGTKEWRPHHVVVRGSFNGDHGWQKEQAERASLRMSRTNWWQGSPPGPGYILDSPFCESRRIRAPLRAGSATLDYQRGGEGGRWQKKKRNAPSRRHIVANF